MLVAVVAVALVMVFFNGYVGPLMVSHRAADTDSDTGGKTGTLDSVALNRPQHPSGNAVNFLVSSKGISSAAPVDLAGCLN